MAQKHIGIPRQTLADRVAGSGDNRYLKAPSGSRYRVAGIRGEDNNGRPPSSRYQIGLEFYLELGYADQSWPYHQGYAREDWGAFFVGSQSKVFMQKRSPHHKGVYGQVRAAEQPPDGLSLGRVANLFARPTQTSSARWAHIPEYITGS